ncbi:hypothetical protein I4U23_022938 [Adineta vaga]|nr:hypothetical protein I4U23_022938 [Adineta vaga]
MSPVCWIIFLWFILTLKATESNQIHRNFIKAVNQVRRNHKLPLICLSQKLNAAALQHSQWMSKNNKLIHGSSKDLKTRLIRNKYPMNGAAAENIALNSDRSAHYTVNQWMKSPKHRASILNPKYNQVGVGANERNRKIWWTMLMARGSDKCILS